MTPDTYIEKFTEIVQTSQLVHNVLDLSYHRPPVSDFRSTLPHLPCKLQPVMYPFIRRHHSCRKLQLTVRDKLHALAFFFKLTVKAKATLVDSVSTKFRRLCERVTSV